MENENLVIEATPEQRYDRGPVTLVEAESYITSGLVSTARNYVAIGYWLRRIRDGKLYEEEGHQNFEQYVHKKFSKDKGWASKCIKVNQQLSRDGDSPLLDSRYQDYSMYQLVELAYMTEEEREQATPDQTVKQLQEIRKPKEIPYYEIEGQQELEKDYPEVIPVVMSQLFPEEEIQTQAEQELPGAEQVEVSQCFETEMGPAANEPESAAEKQQGEARINPEEEQIDERYTIGNLPQAKESLIRRLAALVVRERWLCLKHEFGRISLDTAKSQLEYLQNVQKLDLGDGVEATAGEDIVEFFRGFEDLGVCSYERFTTQVQKCVDAEWEKRETTESDVTSQQEKESAVELTDLDLLRDMLERKKRLLATNLAIPGIDESDEHIRKQKLEVAALATAVCELEEDEVEEQSQPEFPCLKNNNQRAAFIDNYETWPLWIETKETGERYYRYDLPDGTSFVIKTYHSMLYDYQAGVGMRYKEGNGANEQYILEPGKFFRDCRVNRSFMIEKLKELQKGVPV